MSTEPRSAWTISAILKGRRGATITLHADRLTITPRQVYELNSDAEQIELLYWNGDEWLWSSEGIEHKLCAPLRIEQAW